MRTFLFDGILSQQHQETPPCMNNIATSLIIYAAIVALAALVLS